jgi:hypothetical protein
VDDSFLLVGGDFDSLHHCAEELVHSPAPSSTTRKRPKVRTRGVFIAEDTRGDIEALI